MADMKDFAADFKPAAEQVRRFGDEMRKKGIHVGLGANPRCVTCDEPWPCQASAATEGGEG